MSNNGFKHWCDSRGIQAEYRRDVIEKDRSQAEFTLTLAQYLERVLTPDRITTGQEHLRTFACELAELETLYGVDPAVIVAIWGVETRYGDIRGDIPVIDALATLAYDGRRAALFNSQLEAFLPLLDTDIDVSAICGSWAGAFGHTQFMPTSYRDFAVGFDHSGVPILWGDNPLDALASSANYLSKHGWKTGYEWGQNVWLSPDFDVTTVGRHIQKSKHDWADIGIETTLDQDALSLILPMGVSGPAFLVGSNFACVETYNRSETYVFAVCLLADAIAKRGTLPTWPEGHTALLRVDRVALQEHLTRLGFDTFGADGIFGPNTYAALRAYQKSVGLVADGYPSATLLDQIKNQPSP